MPKAQSLCNVPPWILGSREFNEVPETLEIAGVAREHRRLFRGLDAAADPRARSRIFDDYVRERLIWDADDADMPRTQVVFRSSYVRFLRGWSVDSNSVDGAVIKSWVENRFGLPPSFHRVPLVRGDDTAWLRYTEDRMRGTAKAPGIYSQFDLLFHFCQSELRRRHPERHWLELFRGTNDPEQYAVHEVLDRRRRAVRLNNVGSFSLDRERAWEFGSTVWQVRVPTVKVIFFESLCEAPVLRGEGEVVALGGDYLVDQIPY